MDKAGPAWEISNRKERLMQAFHFLAGVLVLLFGRSLYWALIAVLGFLIGFEVVKNLAMFDSRLVQVLVAIGAGILAAGLAVAFQWLAFGLVGFLAGSYLVQTVLVRYNIASEHSSLWILAGGVICGVIALMLVDWAVITLSALAGAMMITGEIPAKPQTRLLILLALTIVGIIFQRSQLKRDQVRR
jgi:Domain of unknown function (DUF4203)